jgi:hypothetical protein
MKPRTKIPEADEDLTPLLTKSLEKARQEKER